MSLTMQSSGRYGITSLKAEMVYFTVTAFIKSSGRNSFTSSNDVNLRQL